MLYHLIFTKIDMKIIVYSAPWCRDCYVAKRWLDENKIAYQDINIEEAPEAAEEVIRRTGKRAIPQFVIDGEWVQPYVPGEGFKYAEMAERLGIPQP
jgi:mycoredoxin